MNYRELIQKLTPLHGAREAQAIVRLVMEERFGLSLSDLLLCKDSELSANNRAEFENIACELLKGLPVQQVLGTATFCGHRFSVTPDVLIPRPETEELVTWILETLETKKYNDKQLRILDIGTGSGCIAISLALALKNAQVTALDIDEKALRVAKNNAAALQAKVQFMQDDILNPKTLFDDIDIIVSNPPYIRCCEAVEMSHTVLDYEPHRALFVPDNDPLLFYKAIANFAICGKAKPCLVFFEINSALGSETMSMLQSKNFKNILLHQDQFGKDRFIKAEIL